VPADGSASRSSLPGTPEEVRVVAQRPDTEGGTGHVRALHQLLPSKLRPVTDWSADRRFLRPFRDAFSLGD